MPEGEGEAEPLVQHGAEGRSDSAAHEDSQQPGERPGEGLLLARALCRGMLSVWGFVAGDSTRGSCEAWILGERAS